MKMLLFLCVFLFNFAKPQEELLVISTKGKIIDASTQQVLKKGDKVTLKTKLIFSDRNAKLALLEYDKLHYILKPTPNAAANGMSVKDMVNAYKASQTGGARDITANVLCNTCNASNNDFKELSVFFSRNVFPSKPNSLEIIGVGRYKINTNAVPLNEKNYFVITYKANGQDILKPIRSEGDFIYLDESIYESNGQKLAPEAAQDMQMHYLADGKTQTSSATYICHLSPNIISKASITAEIEEIIKNMPSKKPKDVFDAHIVPYLIDFYTRLSDEQILDFLPENFKKEVER